ncbi:MAG: virulence factor Mce, partial [Marmoricola sp.]
RVAKILAKPQNQAILNEALDRLPSLFEKQANIGKYGSWYNYYLCDLKARIILPKLDLSTLGIPDLTGPIIAQIQGALDKALEFHSTASRCD